MYSKNENIINAGYWVLSEIAKLNPQQEKLVPAKHKKSPIRKNILPQNFVPHGIRWKNDRSFDQPGPGRYFWFFTCVSSGLLGYLCNHQLHL